MEDAADPATASDPRALRALAHPVRWKLIDILGGEGTATVTRCAEVLGESTATCSYHLGILAKYGYIIRAPAQHGRDRPWRLVSPDLSLSAAGLDADGAVASRAAAAAFLDYELAQLKDSLRHSDPAAGQWQQASKLMAATRWVTAAESRELAGEVSKILDKYAARRDPALRPEGAREVRIFAAIAAAAPREPGQK